MDASNHHSHGRNQHDPTSKSIKRCGKNTNHQQCQDFKKHEIPKFTFRSTTVEIKVYEPSSFSSDEIDSYELTYDELTTEVLEEILFTADLYETDQEKTLKRIS